MYGEALRISSLAEEYYKQHNRDWTVEDGISPKCVSSICEKYDIAYYAFDVEKIVSLKIFQKIEIIKRWFGLLSIIVCILFLMTQIGNDESKERK